MLVNNVEGKQQQFDVQLPPLTALSIAISSSDEDTVLSSSPNNSPTKMKKIEKTKLVNLPGALRSGGAVSLLSREYIGVLAQYAAVGIISLLPATIYPVIQGYFNGSGQLLLTATSLTAIPWGFKIFYGIISDCFPIFGYRRRPYILIGWSIALLMLVLMAIQPMGNPFFLKPEDRLVAPEDYTPEIRARLDQSAPFRAEKYVLLMMGAGFGYILSDVCADGVLVELAQREPAEIRGRTQSIIYSTRTFFQALGQLTVGLTLNGKDYGGEFDFTLGFPSLLWCLVGVLLPILPITWFFIHEEKTTHKIYFSEYIKKLWGLVQTRAVYQVIFYSFFSGIFANFSYTASGPIQLYLVKVTPLANTIFSVFGTLLFLTGIWITGKYGLHWDWRWLTLITGLMVMSLDCVVTMATVWNVYRNQWLYLGLPIVIDVPAGMGFLISTFVVVELADDGAESAMYGLLTTVANLSQPFAATLTKIADAQFDLTTERIQNDSNAVRWDITKSVLLMYFMTLVSWLFLPFLPRQKAETQKLKALGRSSSLLGGLTVLYLVFALCWSVTTNLLGVFESTNCLIIAGGDGCDDN